MRPGPRNLITDVAGLRVGNASAPVLKSGVTVLTADAPFVAAVDVRGGAPGTRETDLLEPGRTLSTDAYRGQVVVLNVWGSWCGPCRGEADALDHVRRQALRQRRVQGPGRRRYVHAVRPRDIAEARGLADRVRGGLWPVGGNQVV